MSFLAEIIAGVVEWFLSRIAIIGIGEIKKVESEVEAKKDANDLVQAKTVDETKSAIDDVAKHL